MAQNDDPRNTPAGENTGLYCRFLYWIECHPRTGWYIAVMATLNVILNLLDAFDVW